MNTRTEFSPDKLRVVGRLAWMRDEDEGHWFSVPSSNDQLVFSENGIYAHSLTGVRIEILQLFNEGRMYSGQDGYVVRGWSRFDDGYHERWSSDIPRFSDLVEDGEELFKCLADGGFEFWSTDQNTVFHWQRTHAVLVEEDGFLALSRNDLQKKLKTLEIAAKAKKAQSRADERRRYEEAAPERAARDATAEARSLWRQQDHYRNLFADVAGVPLDSAELPKQIAYCAHAICEFRLRLGKWESQPSQVRAAPDDGSQSDDRGADAT